MDGIYHVWFSTKGRKPTLEGDIGDDAKRLLVETARRTGINLLEIEAAIDHVHLLVRTSGSQTLPSVMHQLKGATARLIFSEYPELKLDLGQSSFWQKGYGWRRLTEAEAPAVRNYVRTQRERPYRHNM